MDMSDTHSHFGTLKKDDVLAVRLVADTLHLRLSHTLSHAKNPKQLSSNGQTPYEMKDSKVQFQSPEVKPRLAHFLPLLQKEYRKKLLEFMNQFWFNINQTIIDIIENLIEIREKGMTRKEYALSSMSNSIIRPFIFKFFDEPANDIAHKIIEELAKKIGQSCDSASKVDTVRGLWGNLRWDDFLNPQDLYILTPEG